MSARYLIEEETVKQFLARKHWPRRGWKCIKSIGNEFFFYFYVDTTLEMAVVRKADVWRVSARKTWRDGWRYFEDYPLGWDLRRVVDHAGKTVVNHYQRP